MSVENRLKTSFGSFISELLHSKNQTQVFHWQTKSYAKHVALGDYYNTITSLIDTLVESYQGSNGIILDFKVVNNRFLNTSDEIIVNYFSTLLKFVEDNSTITTESDLLNQIDEIKTLLKSTLYKLKHLS